MSKHPKQAAALGALVLVALYFWAPLVWGWVAPADMACQPAAGGTEATPAPATGAVARKETSAASVAPAWDVLVDWMERDPRTSAVDRWANTLNPFRAVVPEVATAEDEKANESELEQELRETVSLSLEQVQFSTIVGPGRRAALINGKTYREGRTVTLSLGEKKLDFQLVAVHAGRIVLERQRKQYELKLPEPGRSERIEWCHKAATSGRGRSAQ
jgi:hypothetical protein